MTGLSDSFQRPIDYLRISVTDRCNLRCIYCTPPTGVELLHRDEILSYEEVIRVAGLLAGMGIRKARITGGEPLVRRDPCYLIHGPLIGNPRIQKRQRAEGRGGSGVGSPVVSHVPDSYRRAGLTPARVSPRRGGHREGSRPTG